MKAIIEAAIYEGKIEDITPLEYFLDNASLSEEEYQKYRNWQKLNKFSFFEVQDVKKGTWVNLKDLSSSEEYQVFEHLGTFDLKKDMILAARILPSQENWVFSGGMIIPLPEEMGYSLKRSKEQILQQPLSQTEFLKIIFGNKENNISVLTYEEAKEKLRAELKSRGIDFDVNAIEDIISKKQDVDFEKIYSKLAQGSKNQDDLQFLTELLHKVWQSHPKFIKEHTKPGPQEQALIRQFMFEAQNTDITRHSSQKSRETLNKLAKNWFNKGQLELEGSTPWQIIKEERKSLGNPNKRFSYQFSLSKTRLPTDELIDIYDHGVYQMSRKYNYFEALKLFAQIADKFESLPEPFRYFCNVGVCLISLGEMNIGKNFFEKSLTIFPDYQIAQNNLKNFQDNRIIENMRQKGKQDLFFQLLEKQLINFELNLSGNHLIKDTVTFLKYIAQNKASVSKIHRNISLPHILEINSKLKEPEEEAFNFKVGKKSASYPKKQESQFLKVNHMHNIALAADMICEEKDKLLITKKGEQFLQLDPEKQFDILFCTFFGRLNWASLNKGDDLRADFLADQGKFLQRSNYQLIMALKELEGQQFALGKLLEQIFPTKSEEEKFAITMLTITLDKLFISFLVWAQILENNTPREILKNPMHILSSLYRLKLTPFGKQVLEVVEKSMAKAIPDVFYKIINQ